MSLLHEASLPPHQVDRRSRRAYIVPALAALLAAVVGVVNIGWALDSHATIRGHEVFNSKPLTAVPDLSVLELPGGVALLIVALYLGLRRQGAWRAALVFLTGVILLSVFRERDFAEGVAGFAIVAVLLWARGAFVVQHDSYSLRSALRRIPLILAVGAAVSVVIVWSASGSAQPAATWSRVLREAGALLFGDPGPLHFPPHFWAPIVVGLIGLTMLAASLFLLFRPLRPPRELPAFGARRLASQLVRSHGGDTLAFFQLRKDKHYLFSRDERAFLAYRVNNGVLLISGDPVGPADALRHLLLEVVGFAKVRGLKLGVIAASEAMLPLFESIGLRSIYFGDEAIIDLEDFSLEGRPIRKVRQSVSRLQRAGYSASVAELGTLDDASLCELEDVESRWRDDEPDRGFSMAMDGLRGEHLDESIVVVARDGDGNARGFLHFVPCYGRPALSLSSMCRDPDTPNGLTEFMIVRAIELLRERGLKETSLNFAVFARTLRSPRGPLERVIATIVRRADRYFQIDSLYRFNAKLFPRWEPRFCLYEGRFGFLRVAVATLTIEGFMPSAPKADQLVARWRGEHLTSSP
ncbi:MAG TPA: phosphatidylglycerol lysyltransferase domain-containing protein [Solirubrobacteraceae bacterium]|nr:phosphatidylglycerol lysyltransferase domain-containing protein [Solirubrobacteraceae bacterium]